MTMSGESPLGDFERSHLVKTLVRAVVSAVLLVVLYYVFPIEHREHQSVALRLSVALVVFSIVLAIEVRQIAKHDHPMLRAGVAMATIIPLFLVLFAWIYLTMSASSPAAFGVQLTRTSALYFTSPSSRLWASATSLPRRIRPVSWPWCRCSRTLRSLPLSSA